MIKTHHIFGIARLAALIILPLIAIVFMNVNNTYAADLTPKYTGWTSAPATEVYVPDISQLSLNTAASTNNVYTYGDLSLITVTSDWAAGGTVVQGNKAIVVKSGNDPFLPGIEFGVFGQAKVAFKNVARYIDKTTGTKKDASIVMTIDGVELATKSSSSNTGATLFTDYSDMSWGPSYTVIKKASETNMGGSFDVKYEFYDATGFSFNASTGAASGTKLNDYVVVFGLTDLDHIDTYHFQEDNGVIDFDQYIRDSYPSVNTHDTCGRINTSLANWRKYATNTTTGKYAEAVTYMTGFKETNLYLERNTIDTSLTNPCEHLNYLFVHNSAWGNNTRLVPRKVNAGDSSISEQRNSGALAVMDAGGFEFHFSSTGAAVSTGFLSTSAIATEAHSNGVTVTAGSNEIFWKEDVDYTITVKDNWELSRVSVGYATRHGQSASDITTIDMDIDTLLANGTLEKISRGRYVYHFRGVTENAHLIVEAEPSMITICKQGEHLTSPALSGASFTIVRSDGGNWSHELVMGPNDLASYTANDTQLTYTTGPSGCITIGGFRDSTLILTETSSPMYFRRIQPITFGYAGNIVTRVQSDDSSEFRYDSHSMTITDKRSTGKLTVAKSIRGTSAVTTDTFNFTITITPGTGWEPLTEVTYTKNGGTATTATLTNNAASFTIGANDTYVFTIPASYIYNITEDDYTAQGYTTTYDRRSGTMSVASVTATIINTKNFTPDTGIFDHGTGPVPFVVAGCVTTTAGLWITLRVRKNLKATK